MQLPRAVRPVPPSRRAPVFLAAAGAALLSLVAGCTSPDSEPAATPPSVSAAGTLPSAHVHGVAFAPEDGAVLMATHEGLVRVGDGGELTPVGPAIDLMGFAVDGDRYLASGHPGPRVDLPQPVGLIESTDGGQTWTALSRQGQSDFHALTASAAGILGYDGTLLRSLDGRTWEQLDIPAEPATLAAAPDGSAVLATTRQGLLRSTDAGTSWSAANGAPLLQVVDWADDGTAVVGVDPAGTVWTSTDAADTWQEGAQLSSALDAVAVATPEGGALRVAVVTADALLESSDGGQTFAVVLSR